MNEALAGVRVLDVSAQIAGPYCSKLFADAGATVIKVEHPAGDPLRRWSVTGADLGARDSALFTFLNAGKQSVVGRIGDSHVAALVEKADVVVGAHGLATDTGERLDFAQLRRDHPHLVLLSITPYGLTGPWADRPANEFTIQAEAGSIGIRGLKDQQPYQAGGRITEWAGGVYGAVAALAAVMRSRSSGRGELIDLSLLETAYNIFSNYAETANRLLQGSPGEAEAALIGPSLETPSIERTSDGYVGFCTNTRQQFSDFLAMIDRPDLQEDERYAQLRGRLDRWDEWNAIISDWLEKRTTAEVIELASLLRIPVAPICNGRDVLAHEQLEARGVFVPDARKTFVQPRRPYRLDDIDPPGPDPAPALGEHTTSARFVGDLTPIVPGSDTDDARPLAGLRLLDLTAWWAGPSATQIMASLGAEVIHVESTSRPDGMRFVGGMMAAHYDHWWEAGTHFLHANTNKLGLTLDLTSSAGIGILERLVAASDAVIENFTPRVLEGFGLTWERIQSLNPEAIMVRMPAFGLTGPWRNNTGFAQTMEQLSGMAWLTGHPDDQPRIPRGPCDPLAGMHAAFSFLVALAERARTGHGHHVESTMIESVLNVAAEQILEWTAFGNLMERQGNRSPLAAPQGLYACADDGSSPTGRWLALSVSSDDEWKALRAAMGDPDWASEKSLETAAGRRAAHDVIDAYLSEWTSTFAPDQCAELLRSHGVLASPVVSPCRVLQSVPQHRARGYFEAPDHPVVGSMPIASLPFRFEGVEGWLRSPAPTLGQHNTEVLSGLLDLSREELQDLEAAGVIGTRPVGV